MRAVQSVAFKKGGSTINVTHQNSDSSEDDLAAGKRSSQLTEGNVFSKSKTLQKQQTKRSTRKQKKSGFEVDHEKF